MKNYKGPCGFVIFVNKQKLVHIVCILEILQKMLSAFPTSLKIYKAEKMKKISLAVYTDTILTSV